MKSRLKCFDSYWMFMSYRLLFGEKQTHFFKSPYHLEKKHDLFWNFASMFSSMSSTRMKILMEKNCLESMHYCYLTTKIILGLKKIQRNGLSNS
jgi:hypothetical protein